MLGLGTGPDPARRHRRRPRASCLAARWGRSAAIGPEPRPGHRRADPPLDREPSGGSVGCSHAGRSTRSVTPGSPGARSAPGRPASGCSWRRQRVAAAGRAGRGHCWWTHAATARRCTASSSGSGRPGNPLGTYPSGGTDRVVLFYGLIAHLLWREFSGSRQREDLGRRRGGRALIQPGVLPRVPEPALVPGHRSAACSTVACYSPRSSPRSA